MDDAAQALDAPLTHLETAGAVAILTLNRPKARNALSQPLMEALLAALETVEQDKTIKAMILRGAGPGFCAGHDLKELTAMRAEPDAGAGGFRQVFETCSRLMTAIVRLRVPVIAEVQGVATAAGCQLVASCDLAVASEAAQFATPGVNIGLFCSTPMVALSRNVARKHAMEMLLLGEMASARRAAEIGLVNRVVAPEALTAEARAMADVIVSKSPKALKIGKAAFYRQLEHDLDGAYAYAAEVMVANMLEDDAVEGVGAFVEKRAPQWPE